MEKITAINDVINSFVWGKGVWLLIATGILMTALTKFFQISHIGEWWRNTIGSLFKKDVIGHSREAASISPFQALCTALAATVGTGNIAEGASDATLVATAFNQIFPWGGIGAKFIAVAMFLFAFTTVLGWSHYGSKAWEYVFGAKTTVIFKIIHVITTVFGAVLSSSLAWDISDTFNGLMMLPNLIGVLAMSGLVMKITKNYIDRKKKGLKVEPIISYDPKLQAEQVMKMKQDGEL